MAFSSTLIQGIYYILMRELRQVHFSVVSFTAGCFGFVGAGALAFGMNVFKVPEGTNEILLVVGLGLLSFAGSIALVGVLKFEEAETVIKKFKPVPNTIILENLKSITK